jgi:hypothetical protein
MQHVLIFQHKNWIQKDAECFLVMIEAMLGVGLGGQNRKVVKREG